MDVMIQVQQMKIKHSGSLLYFIASLFSMILLSCPQSFDLSSREYLCSTDEVCLNGYCCSSGKCVKEKDISDTSKDYVDIIPLNLDIVSEKMDSIQDISSPDCSDSACNCPQGYVCDNCICITCQEFCEKNSKECGSYSGCTCGTYDSKKECNNNKCECQNQCPKICEIPCVPNCCEWYEKCNESSHECI
jgi:hypothetical protein